MRWQERQPGYSHRLSSTMMTKLHKVSTYHHFSKHPQISIEGSLLRLRISSESLNEPQPTRSNMATTQFVNDVNQSKFPRPVAMSLLSSSSTPINQKKLTFVSQRRQEQVAPAVSTTDIKFEFLNAFPTAGTLNLWVQTLLTNSMSALRVHNKQEPLESETNSTVKYMKYGSMLPTRDDIDSLWSMNDHVSFLLAIGQHSVDTVPSILQYTSMQYMSKYRVGKNKSFVDFYIAAFQALLHQKLLQQRQQQLVHVRNLSSGSNQIEIQAACMDIVKMMKKNSIITSPKVMAILLPLYCGYTSYDAIQLRQQLLQYYPNLIWSESIWIQAIQSCCYNSSSKIDDPFSSSYTYSIRTNVSDKGMKYSTLNEGVVRSGSTRNATTSVVIWECANHLYNEYLNSTTIPNKKTTGCESNSVWTIPSERICMTMLQLCIITKNITNAMTFVDQLLQTPPKLHVKEKSKINENSAALDLPMTPRLWAMLLKVCAAAGDHRMAYQVLGKMGEQNQMPNVRHCTVYLKALVESNELDLSAQFLAYMASSSNLNNYFSNIVIDGLPDMVAVKTVLNGCSMVGNYTLARQICDNVKTGYYGDHLQMDEQCYNMLLSTCTNSTIAKEILREIRLTRRHRWGVVRASAITYTKAIAVCRKSRDVDMARSFLSLARNDGIPPDSFMYSSGV